MQLKDEPLRIRTVGGMVRSQLGRMNVFNYSTLAPLAIGDLAHRCHKSHICKECAL